MPKRISKKSKKTPKNTPEKERHFGVILEDINSNIGLVIKRQDILDRKIDETKKDLKSELEDFRLETQSNFKTVFDYLSRIDNELQEIKSEIKELKIKLDKKADISRLENLEQRVKKLEIILQRRLAGAG